MCFLYEFTLCDFRIVFGALVSSSSDPTAEPNTGERCTVEEGSEQSVKEQSRVGGEQDRRKGEFE